MYEMINFIKFINALNTHPLIAMSHDHINPLKPEKINSH